MRFWIAGICLATIAMAQTSPAWAQQDDPLSEYQQPGINLPDPVANNGTHFAPSTATAGTADAGPTLDMVRTDNKGCNALNPCAVLNPVLNDTAPRRQASGAKSSSSS